MYSYIHEDKRKHEGNDIVLRYQVERKALNPDSGLTCNRGNCSSIGARHDQMTLLTISINGQITEVRDAVSVIFKLPPEIQKEIKVGKPLQIISCIRHVINDLTRGL